MDSISALVNPRNERLSAEPADYRTPSERDRDRVLYCSAFRRLGSVTQVIGVGEAQLFHNRLTHSLKVAQIGRRLAQKLKTMSTAKQLTAAGGIDEDVVEAAALAHDLGLPPFGRAAEKELQGLLTEEPVDGFEGNAQSFRIVTKLAFRSGDKANPALNLTRATLKAILKYPWTRGQSPEGFPKEKWGAYESEKEALDFAVKGGPLRKASAEACLMEWSDDVTYGVHDVEDFYRSGLIPVDRLVGSDNVADAFITWASAQPALDGCDRDQCAEAFSMIRSLLPTDPYEGSLENHAALHRMASTCITRYVDALTIGPDGDVRVEDQAHTEVTILKLMTQFYVIDNPILATVQRGERKVISDLFRELRQWAGEASKSQRELARLPATFRELLLAIRSDPGAMQTARDDDSLNVRATLDYIASLTEVQAIGLHERLMDHPSASSLEAWARL